MARFDSGKRFPLLYDDDNAIPLGATTENSLLRRLSGWSVSSISAELRGIAIALQWAARNGVDLEQRIGDGSLLTAFEIIALRDALRVNLVTQGAVVPLVFYTRCLHVRDYIKLCAEYSLQKRQGDDPRLGYSRHRLAEFMQNMMEFLPKPRSGNREGITAAIESRLLEIIRPGHPENPSRYKNQHRNHAHPSLQQARDSAFRGANP